MNAETLARVNAADNAIKAWKAQYPKGARRWYDRRAAADTKDTFPGNVACLAPYRETINGPVGIAMYVNDVSDDVFNLHSGYELVSDALPPAVFGLPEEMDGITTLVFCYDGAVRSGKWAQPFTHRYVDQADREILAVAQAVANKFADRVSEFTNISGVGPGCDVRVWDGAAGEWVYTRGPCVRLTVMHPDVFLGHDGPLPESVDVDVDGAAVSVPVCVDMGVFTLY